MGFREQRQIEHLNRRVVDLEDRLEKAERRIGFFADNLQHRLAKAVEKVIGDGLELDTQPPADVDEELTRYLREENK